VTERRDGAVVGPDGRLRCPWALSTPDYRIFERLTLEAFQSGLSWLTILRKREAFRAAFADFSIPAVAAFDGSDVERLMADAGIVRNRTKIEAALNNARAASDLEGGLSALVWSFAPDHERPGRQGLADVPSLTPESTAMAKELKRLGFRFVGPTTAYALMQACGLVDDHLAGCIAASS
jgi:DNA-3-methyladenine glycosylase I